MKVVSSIEEIPSLEGPISLTIGVFDALHLGHLYLIQEAKKRGFCALLTFTNHPSSILRKEPISPLLSLEEKIALLEKAGVDLLIQLPFTPELASLPYTDFLKRVRRFLPFTTLVLGKGAAFGKNREGTETNIRAIAPSLGFSPLYLEKKEQKGAPISTSAIRALIAEGKTAQVEPLLGRPYTNNLE